MASYIANNPKEDITMINKKKMRDELLCAVSVILGVIFCIINFKYAMPGTDGDMNKVIAFFVSIAWLPGILFIVGGIATFIEVRDKKYPRNKAR